MLNALLHLVTPEVSGLRMLGKFNLVLITSWCRVSSVSSYQAPFWTKGAGFSAGADYFVVIASVPELQLRQPLFNGHPPFSNS
jgi:hypothetical protein